MLLDAVAVADGRRVAPLVDEVERLLTARLRARGPAATAVADAARQVRDLDGAAPELCVEELLSRVLFEVCVELDDPAAVASIVGAVAERAGQDPVLFRYRLGRAVLAAPQLLEIREDVATRGLVSMASVIAPVKQLSLWRMDDRTGAVLVAHVGEPLAAPEPDALGPDDLLVFPVASGASRVVLVTRVAADS